MVLGSWTAVFLLVVSTTVGAFVEPKGARKVGGCAVGACRRAGVLDLFLDISSRLSE